MGIILVGLGPAGAESCTREAWEILSQARVVYVRTSQHPAVAELPAGVEVVSFDNLYETAEHFGEVHQQIVGTLLQLGRAEEVILAVPGHPLVGEAAAYQLYQRAQAEGLPVRVVNGISYFEPFLTAIGQEGTGFQLLNALEIIEQDYPQLSPDRPVMMNQVYSQWVASQLKLSLTAVYPDEHPVQLVYGLGTSRQKVEALFLYEIDRSPFLDPLTMLYVPPLPRRSDLASLAEAMATLRGPHGCPWDQEQTPQSLRPGLMEEVAEVLEALDRDDKASLREELGDVLLHITMQTQMATEEGHFTLSEVIGDIYAKIVRRHPHVWGEVAAGTVEQVVKNWEAIKAEEKGRTPQPISILSNIPHTLPALAHSQKIQDKVRKVGFDWAEIRGVYDKLQEEIRELQEATRPGEQEAELGDILFVTVNLAKWLKIDAETALRGANRRFSRRFQVVEQLAYQRGLILSQMDEPALTALWQEAKLIMKPDEEL